MSGKAWSAKAAARRFDLALTLGSAGGVSTEEIQRCMALHLARAFLAGIKAANPSATGEFLARETARLLGKEPRRA